ncbi:MAG: zf-HC2 domain-containing protein, partial [Vicinamibacterales bacterium]
MTRECQEIRDLLDSYLSDELLVETNHLVLRHLATCGSCSSELERRRRTRELLVESLRVTVDPESLRQRIDQAIDAERLWWRRTALWWGSAAVLAAIAVFIWYPRAVDAAAYDDSVGDHVACALAVRADAWYDPARVAKQLRPPFTPLAEAVGTTYRNFALIDAHTCPYNGREYAHLVFRGTEGTISLFAEASTRGALPKASVVASQGHALSSIYSTDRDGYHVDATSTERHQLFVVSDRTGP